MRVLKENTYEFMPVASRRSFCMEKQIHMRDEDEHACIVIIKVVIHAVTSTMIDT